MTTASELRPPAGLSVAPTPPMLLQMSFNQKPGFLHLNSILSESAYILALAWRTSTGTLSLPFGTKHTQFHVFLQVS